MSNKIQIKGLEDEHKAHKQVGQLSLDIIHTDKEIIILAPIAGTLEENVRIILNKDVLTISGNRSPRYEIEEDKYYTKECFWGEFSRSIVLPLEADYEKISASFEQNVLEIKIPRDPQKKQPQIIKIKKA